MECVGQPVLARQVPDRRPRPGALHALRRGRVRRHREGHPVAAPRGRGGLAWGLHARERRAGLPGHLDPETYLGYERARGFVPGAAGPGLHRYQGARRLPQSRFAIEGEWRGARESATAGRDAALSARFLARRVFLVLSSRGDRPQDGARAPRRPPDPAERGRERRSRWGASGLGPAALPARVAAQSRGPHAAPELPPGITGYAFTFG